MKILKVTFNNLNSLKGEHCIDFENGLLGEAGIFSITGPTGAGKSTILDAITLALFGKAARYESEASPGEMMTRGTGECAAEVLFECRKGRYVAKWTRARARKKAGGKLQHAKREISEMGSGDILAEKIKEADDLVEELTGLDYQRFLRSVLLAQGRFKEFLDAGDNERGDLLEKITGTEIYSRISRKTYEFQSEKKDQIDQARQQMDGLQLKSEEELDALRKEQSEKEEALQDLEKTGAGLKKKIKLFEDFDKQSKTLDELKQELEAWKIEDEAFAAERERLGKHEATQVFQEALIKLDEQRSQHRALSMQLEGLSADARQKQSRAGTVLIATVAFVETAIKTKAGEIQAGETKKEKFADEEQVVNAWLKTYDADKGIEVILPDIRSLGETIRSQHAEQAGQQERLDQVASDQEQLEKDWVQKKAEMAASNEKLVIARSALEAAEKSFVESAGEQSIEQWREQAKFQRTEGEGGRNLQSIRQVWSATFEKAEQSEQVLPVLREACKKARQVHSNQQEVNGKAQAVLEDKERIYQQARLIATYEQQRGDLKSGEACPLCGAEEHPYAEQLENNENADLQALNEQKKVVQLEREALNDKSQQVVKAESALDHQELKNKELGDTLQQKVAEFNAAAEQIAYSSSIEEVQAFEDFLLKIEQQREQTESRIERLEILEKEQREKRQGFEKLEGEQRVAGSQLESLEQLKDKLVETGQGLEKRIADGGVAILSLLKKFNQKLVGYGGKVSAADETQRCSKDLEGRVYAYHSKVKELESARGQIKDLAGQLKMLGQELKRFEEEGGVWRDKLEGFDKTVEQDLAMDLEVSGDEMQRRQNCLEMNDEARQAEQKFKQQGEVCEQQSQIIKADTEAIRVSLDESPFESIDALREARLDAGSLKQIKLKQEGLKERRHTLQGQMVQTQKELKKLEDELIPSADEFVTIEFEFKELSEQQNANNRRLGEITLLIKQDAEARVEQAGQLKQIEVLEKELRPWSELNALIGSANGSVFSKFAQGLTLAQLLQLANRHLIEINDRYQIQRSSEGELGLQIIDLYQGDAVRPTRSLSGGESFLISLALALGLSDLAGSDTRIESLFIDEGFGTLDSETLDMALAALENLRMSNRTIGIISHVDALKQRISAQIQVSKSSNGYGALEIVNGG